MFFIKLGITLMIVSALVIVFFRAITSPTEKYLLARQMTNHADYPTSKSIWVGGAVLIFIVGILLLVVGGWILL